VIVPRLVVSSLLDMMFSTVPCLLMISA
jgi:hypothetical protein